MTKVAGADAEAGETESSGPADERTPARAAPPRRERGKTVHGEAANAGHRVLAPDDAEVEAYLETALDAPAPDRAATQATATAPGPVVVLDFGSQFAQLIARRVRELDVYSELLPARHAVRRAGAPRHARDHPVAAARMSVYDEGAPKPDPAIWSGRIPVLGICYGAQLMAHELGGDVLAAGKREYGPANVQLDHERRPVPRPRPRPAGLDEPRRLDHAAARGLRLDRPDGLHAVRRPRRPPTATCTGSSSTPRSSHTPRGRDVLRNFVPGHRRHRAVVDGGQLHRDDRRRRSANGSTATPARPAPTARSSARCRAASTRPSPRRSSIGPSAIG